MPQLRAAKEEREEGQKDPLLYFPLYFFEFASRQVLPFLPLRKNLLIVSPRVRKSPNALCSIFGYHNILRVFFDQNILHFCVRFVEFLTRVVVNELFCPPQF